MKKNLTKKIILFDIDYTLWHTDDFRDQVYPRLAPLTGYSLSEFIDLAKELDHETKKIAGAFHLAIWIDLLKKHSRMKVPNGVLENIFEDQRIYSLVLEKGIGSLLQQLQKKEYEIGIFSTGEQIFQLQKIASIKHLFQEEHIHIANNKIAIMEPVLTRYSNDRLIIVDDLPTVLSSAKQYHPTIITVLRKTKKRYELTEETRFTPDYTISELKELITFLP